MLDAAALAKVRRLMEARVKRDEDKAAAERSEREYREIEAETWESLEDTPLKPPYKVDLGPPYGVVSFHPRETIYGRVIDNEAALDYLESAALVDDFTKPKLVMARVNELVRERYEEGESMPPGLDFYPKRFVAITVQKD